MKYCWIFFSVLLLIGCQQKDTPISISSVLKDAPHINGKNSYLNSPMVTAGNRVYMVGHQNGSFPELGWHIKGEMGGIWNHPIKLMDGFDIELSSENDQFILNQANQFTNFPFANKHTFNWTEKQLKIERWQFVPDDQEGIIIQLNIHNQGVAKSISVSFTGHSDLRPTWLGERTQMIDGKDFSEWHTEKKAFIVKDSLNKWYTVFGSTKEPINHFDKQVDQRTVNSLAYHLELQPGENLLTFVIAGSYTSEDEVWNTYHDLQRNWPTYLTQKKERYQNLADQTKLTTPDSLFNQTFEWLKYNSDWLVRSVPEIGTGIGAGIPDYPWWFVVDSEYALQGYMGIGQWDPAFETVQLLDSVSNAVNGNGRIIHEMSTNGAVFNLGNINETPQFVSLIWKMYQWTGDKEFLEKYYPTLTKGMDWLLTEKDENGNLFPDGFGMMEIHGMDSEMIDVAVYTQKALEDLNKIHFVLKGANNAQYLEKAHALKNKINSLFWNEEFKSYADFIGSDEQALKLIEDAIVRADTLQKPWAVTELKQTKDFIIKNPSSQPRPFVLHHNWVVNTPMEMGIAPKEKALKALTTTERFTNPFGVFVTGIDRDDTAGSDASSFEGSKVFSYTGAVMTLPTGVQAIAENNYGRPNNALDYLQRMTRSFSYALPGSMYEVSPDYGMMTQAWNIYAFAIPVVEQFFGIQPNAAEKTIVIRPQMPSEWDKASLEHVKVGANEISIFYDKTSEKLSVNVQQTQPGWTLKVQLPKTETSKLPTTKGTSEVSSNPEYYEVIVQSPSEEIVLSYE